MITGYQVFGPLDSIQGGQKNTPDRNFFVELTMLDEIISRAGYTLMRQFSSCVRNMKPKDLFFLYFFSNPIKLVLSDLFIFQNFVDLRMCKKASIPILLNGKAIYCYIYQDVYKGYKNLVMQYWPKNNFRTEIRV